MMVDAPVDLPAKVVKALADLESLSEQLRGLDAERERVTKARRALLYRVAGWRFRGVSWEMLARACGCSATWITREIGRARDESVR